MSVPFFFPESARDLSAIADLPDDSLECKVAVMLLLGVGYPRISSVVSPELARRLASRGHPVLRIDDPGSGLSTTGPMTTTEFVRTLEEACHWFLEASGVTALRLAGDCRGSLVALALAARLPSVTHVAAIDCPMRQSPEPRRGPLRVRAGVAAIDSIGTRLLPKLTQGVRAREATDEWFPNLVRNIVAGVSTTEITFLFGRENPSYRDFRSLLVSGNIPPDVRDGLRVIVSDGNRFYSPWTVDEIPKRVSILEDLLSVAIEENADG